MSRNNTNTNPSGNGVDQFTSLIDCPSTFVGSANKVCTVNPAETALIFTTAGVGPGNTMFIQGTDTPGTYAGSNPSDIVNVNGTTTGVRFTSPANIATNGIALENLSNVSIVPPAHAGYYLTANGLNQWIATAPNEPPNDPALNILDTNPVHVSLAYNSTTNYNVQTIPAYITLNQGFTTTVPINFSPIISNPLFSLNWSVNIALHRFGVENVNHILTIALYTSTSLLVTTLLTQSINSLTIGSGVTPPTPFTFSGLTPNIALNAGTQYQLQIMFHNSCVFSFLDVYFNSKNFDWLAGQGEYLERALDYLTFGYGTNGQTLVSNGVNGFNLQTLPNKISTQTDYLNGTPYGSNGQVVTSNGVTGFTLQTPTPPTTLMTQLTDMPNNYGITNQVLSSNGSSVIWQNVPSIVSAYTVGVFTVVLNGPINSNANPTIIMNGTIGGVNNNAIQFQPSPLIDLSQYNGMNLRLTTTIVNNFNGTIANLDTLNTGIGFSTGVNFQTNSYQYTGNGTLTPYCQFFYPQSSVPGLYSNTVIINSFVHSVGRFYYPICLLNFLTGESFGGGTYINVTLTVQAFS